MAADETVAGRLASRRRGPCPAAPMLALAPTARAAAALSLSVATLAPAAGAAPQAEAPAARPGPPVPRAECGLELSETERRVAFQQWMGGAYALPPGAAPAGDGPGAQVTHYVPLFFHVVRDSSGLNGIPQARLDQALVDANDAFAGSGIQFCVAGQDTIDDSFYHSQMSDLSDINALRQTSVVPDAIDIYFVESFPYCGISSFTFSSVQGIVMNNACTALPTNRSTFPHEIAHYFDVYHTHETFQGPECVNGSNCAFAGDLVCDTPADPNVLGLVSGACQYTGASVDPCAGVAYDPPIENFMSYSRKECRDRFTQGQRERALATLLNLRPELANRVCGDELEFLCDPAVPNSTGLPAALTLSGSAFVGQNALTLLATQVPPGQFTMFVNSRTATAPVSLPASAGQICLGVPIARHNQPGLVTPADATGAVTQVLDLTALPAAIGVAPVTAGESRTFQLWFRDVGVGGAATSNFSNAVTIEFR